MVFFESFWAHKEFLHLTDAFRFSHSNRVGIAKRSGELPPSGLCDLLWVLALPADVSASHKTELSKGHVVPQLQPSACRSYLLDSLSSPFSTRKCRLVCSVESWRCLAQRRPTPMRKALGWCLSEWWQALLQSRQLEKAVWHLCLLLPTNWGVILQFSRLLFQNAGALWGQILMFIHTLV